MRVVSVVGNRPQFIKAAAVSVALREAGIDEVVVHTGQHYDPELSQVFFDELGLAPADHALELHTADPHVMRPAVAEVIRAERPDWVLVYGDTNSTLAGARAAAEAGIPLAHVEAGLRSGDLSMPEERTRIEVDRISDLLLCPDERSAAVLAGEQARGHAEVVGDVMYDVALRLRPIAERRSKALERFGVTPRAYVLATVHREANVRPDRLPRILEGLTRIREPVVFPAHPRTARAARSGGLSPGLRGSSPGRRGQAPGHVVFSPPLGYLDLAALASQARVIATDSGGLQKEAYWYGVPCVTMRPSTEWVDTVELGANVLVDDDPDRIVAAVEHARMPRELPPLYGDGNASARVAAALVASLAPS